MKERDRKTITLFKKLNQYYQNVKEIERKTYILEGEKLFPVEVHVLREVFHKSEIGVTELAGNLGVTKGAVSQKLKILSSKGLLISKKCKSNRKKLYLTEKGKRICEIHDAAAQKFYNNIMMKLAVFSDSDKQTFIDILTKINGCFRNCFFNDDVLIKKE